MLPFWGKKKTIKIKMQNRPKLNSLFSVQCSAHIKMFRSTKLNSQTYTSSCCLVQCIRNLSHIIVHFLMSLFCSCSITINWMCSFYVTLTPNKCHYTLISLHQGKLSVNSVVIVIVGQFRRWIQNDCFQLIVDVFVFDFVGLCHRFGRLQFLWHFIQFAT